MNLLFLSTFPVMILAVLGFIASFCVPVRQTYQIMLSILVSGIIMSLLFLVPRPGPISPADKSFIEEVRRYNTPKMITAKKESLFYSMGGVEIKEVLTVNEINGQVDYCKEMLIK